MIKPEKSANKFSHQKNWFYTILKTAFLAVYFCVLLVLLSIICIGFYFPEVSFNQLVFHTLYLDTVQLSYFKRELFVIAAGALSATYFMYKKPRLCALFTILLVVGLCIWQPLAVSSIKEDKPIPLLKQIALSFQTTDLYKQLHIPDLQKPNKPKNLIVIFAESMESNFTDPVLGENLIPFLDRLAQENTTLRGYRSVNGTNWTLASQIATFCGIPLRMQLRDRLGQDTAQFLPNALCLSDILQQYGYYNVFVNGTYLAFAGTGPFLAEHHFHELWGRDEFLDSGHATEQDIHMEQFGINDAVLFQFARRKITQLSQKHEPFFISLTTLDTHFPHGFTDPSCPVTYHDTRDAVKCSDKMIYDFIRWYQQQPFYSNTVLVLIGDHLTMTSSDMEPLLKTYPHRETYNVILDPSAAPRRIIKPHSQLDWAPTLLDLLGLCSDCRLGLGTSLLRSEKTWVEKIGPISLEEELLKNSPQYNYLLGKNS